MAAGETTMLVERWLKELPTSDSPAAQQIRNALIEQSRRRMEAVCRKTFFKSLVASPVDWEDIYQEAALRLWKSLESVRPATARQFFGLACEQIRRTLVDMCRKYSKRPPVGEPDQDSTFDPVTMGMWTDFWEQVEKLPTVSREVFDLIWIQGLTQIEAAEVLEVDESTVKRRWRATRDLLAAYLP